MTKKQKAQLDLLKKRMKVALRQADAADDAVDRAARAKERTSENLDRSEDAFYDYKQDISNAEADAIELKRKRAGR